MKYEIRRLGEKDFSLALDLLSNWNVGGENYQHAPRSKNEIIHLLRNENNIVIAAISNEKAIGGLTGYILPMFTRKENKFFLYEIEIHKDYRRKGVGTNLLLEIFEFTKTLNIQSIFLLTEPSNHAAKSFYNKLGGKYKMIPKYTF